MQNVKVNNLLISISIAFNIIILHRTTNVETLNMKFIVKNEKFNMKLHWQVNLPKRNRVVFRERQPQRIFHFFFLKEGEKRRDKWDLMI